MNKVLDEHQFYNIDFMNLDIEGHELNVLRTVNFDKIKIKFLCVEMIEHNKESIKNKKSIELLLDQNNFKLIQNFDYNYIYKKVD